jgi:DNA-binding transcriptional LysR family regulator
MSPSRPKLDRLAVFVVAAEAAGFTAAATRLGTTKAHVSQQIARLEEQLNVTLFSRSTRKVVLTEEGAELYAECAPLLDRLQEAVGRVGVQRDALSGRLRVTVGVDHLNAGFAEPLAEFARLHPRLTLDVLATDAIVDLVGEGVDLAIRRGWLKDSALKAVSLGEFEQWIVAAPDYLRRHGKPQRPEQLAPHQCILFTALKGEQDRWSLVGPGGAQIAVKMHGSVRCSSPVGVLALARAGAGIASVASGSALPDIARGSLVRLLPEWKLRKAGVFAVYPAGRYVAPKTRALVEFLRTRYVGSRVSLA